jgi:hypothetical protein
MKRFLVSNLIVLLLLPVFACLPAKAVPQALYDEMCGKGQKCQGTFTSDAHSAAYWKKLNDDFDKKYPPRVTPTAIEVTAPMGAYQKEVLDAYASRGFYN